MNTLRTCIAASILLVAVSLPVRGEQASNFGKVQVVAAPVNEGLKNVGIRFVIRNEGAGSVDLYRDMLPWNSRNSTTLTLIPLAKGMKPMDQVRLLDDPGGTTVKLNAGDEISGVVQLSDCFQEYHKVTSRVEHAIFWSLALLEPNSANVRRYSGTVEFLLRKSAK